MKKLMIMLAAVVVAVAANASTVSWGISGGTLDTEKFASGTAYLFYTSASTMSLPSTTDWDKKTSWTESDITASGVTKYGTGAVVNGEFSESGLSITSLDGTTGTKRFYMAVISDDGKNVALVTSTKTGRIMASTTGVALTWNPSQFNVYSPASVPEPTSGLLLVLGLAGLALRRRKA